MDKDHLRTGDKATCRFRFIKGPEFIEIGTKMIFREGRTKAVGTITKLHQEIEGKSTHNTRQSKQHKALMHHRAQAANKRANIPIPVTQITTTTTVNRKDESQTNIAQKFPIVAKTSIGVRTVVR